MIVFAIFLSLAITGFFTGITLFLLAKKEPAKTRWSHKPDITKESIQLDKANAQEPLILFAKRKLKKFRENQIKYLSLVKNMEDYNTEPQLFFDQGDKYATFNGIKYYNNKPVICIKTKNQTGRIQAKSFFQQTNNNTFPDNIFSFCKVGDSISHVTSTVFDSNSNTLYLFDGFNSTDENNPTFWKGTVMSKNLLKKLINEKARLLPLLQKHVQTENPLEYQLLNIDDLKIRICKLDNLINTIKKTNQSTQVKHIQLIENDSPSNGENNCTLIATIIGQFYQTGFSANEIINIISPNKTPRPAEFAQIFARTFNGLFAILEKILKIKVNQNLDLMKLLLVQTVDLTNKILLSCEKKYSKKLKHIKIKRLSEEGFYFKFELQAPQTLANILKTQNINTELQR